MGQVFCAHSDFCFQIKHQLLLKGDCLNFIKLNMTVTIIVGHFVHNIITFCV